ncbi:MAG: hypothetical protein IJF73_03305 [Clostridia bacterium]|nr:hypothetical protein [Clostridia bacterium]
MKSAGKIIKILIAAVVLGVAAAFVFRFWLGSYYPSSMRTLIPTAPLREAYAAGELSVKSQKIRIEYEDPRDGLFFAGELLVAPETGSLQVTVRYNRSTLSSLAAEHGDAFDPEADRPFTYRIFCSRGAAADGVTPVGEEHTPVDSRRDSFAIYEYERLAFEGLELDGVYWVRLDIYRAGAEEPEGSIVIYENHEKYNEFEDYNVKNGELS